MYHQKYPEQYFNVQGPTDNMSYGDAVNFAYERMRMINEMPLQKDDMHVSEKINDQDYFRMANHNSLRSNQTALATFNGLDTYNPNEHGEIPMPKLNEHQNLGESFGRPEAMSETSSEQMKLRSYQSIKSLQSKTEKQSNQVSTNMDSANYNSNPPTLKDHHSVESIQSTRPKAERTHHRKKSSLKDLHYSQPTVVFQAQAYGHNKSTEKSFSLIDEQSLGSNKQNPSYKEAISSIHQQFGQSVSVQDNQDHLMIARAMGEFDKFARNKESLGMP